MKGKGKTKRGDDDESLLDLKICDEGKANTIHFSKNMS